ncbi:MAG: uncharacterized protein QOI04_441 [Verrucomicrobiota bacterium]|jgi:uncharacterized membrane protein YraQ (UPF0718 family)
MNWLWLSLYHALSMFWETFWALVLGFGISAALQVFISREQMTRAFGETNLRSLGLATGLGAASSSCSYAAVAAGRSAFEKGAALIPVLAFMFASTNLVIELGAVLWLLMGWRFVLAETIGALVLIGVMWIFMSILFPKKLEQEARDHAKIDINKADHCHDEHDPDQEASKWKRVANAFVMDWQMLWKEIAAGFLIAGFLAALVPASWWQFVFLRGGNPALRLIENAAVGPLIAVGSFVCSIGNIPLASLLWANGISFGGVISFIYGDLIVIPLLIIYAKYYGMRAATYITIVFYLSMVIAGIIVDLVFNALDLIPQGARTASPMAHAMIQFNYTAWLDGAALVVFLTLLVLHFKNERAPHAS